MRFFTTLIPTVGLSLLLGCGSKHPPTPSGDNSSADVEAFKTAGQTAADLFATRAAGGDTTAARTAALAQLRTAAGVESASLTPDGDNIWFVTRAGYEGYLITRFDPEEPDSAPGIAPEPRQPGSRETASLAADDLPNRGGALLLDPQNLEPDQYATDVANLRAIGYEESEIRQLRGAAVTRATFDELPSCSYFQFYGHTFLSRTGDRNLCLLEPFVASGMNGQGFDSRVWWKLTGMPTQPKLPYWSVSAHDIRPAAGRCSGAVIVINACYSMRASGFAGLFPSDCLVFGWMDSVYTDVAAEAAHRLQTDLRDPAVGATAKQHWNAPRAGVGRSTGPDALGLVVPSDAWIGSWLGQLVNVPGYRIGDLRWGLTLPVFGWNGVSGRIGPTDFAGGTWQQRGFRFSCSLAFEPGATPAVLTIKPPTGTATERTVECQATFDGQTGVFWTGTRVSPSPTFDNTPPTMVSASPAPGTNPGTSFDLAMTWSEPMGNWWSDGCSVTHGSGQMDYDRYDAVTFTPHLRVTISPDPPTSTDSDPCVVTIPIEAGGWCDIWGNFINGGPSLTYIVPRVSPAVVAR